MQRTHFKKTNSGYTIIETMIAIALFSIVITMGMTTLLNANLIQQKSQNLRSEMDNLSFIMDDMSRNLRTGSDYYCITGSNGIPTPLNVPRSGQSCWGIAFEPSGGKIASAPPDQWVYFIGTNGTDSKVRIFRAQGAASSNFNFSDFTQLTDDEIQIDPNLSGFSVLGAEPPPGDLQQPFVIIRLVGTITSQGVATPFSLETSVSQRLIDI